MNLVEAELAVADGGLDATFGEHTLRLGAATAARPGRAIIGIRPEDFEDAALGQPAPGSTLTVVPEIREDMGAEVYVHFGLGVPPVRRADVAEAKTADDEPARPPTQGRNPFVARVARGTAAAEGQPMTLSVNVDRIYVFDAETGEGTHAG
jgi:multiple sugar transport system ATP-binding protein